MDFNTTKSIKKQSSLKRPSEKTSAKTAQKLCDKVTLEKVLGLTVKCNSHIVVHEASEQCAYLAGSVVVILNSKNNKQIHVINTCRKTLSSVDFNQDGCLIATGEAGHQPAVRVWTIDPNVIADNGYCGIQVAELLGHSFGIPVVAFAPFSSLLVSVGNQHDMDINVWNWKTGVKVASNKVSAKVQTVSFSEDGKWFVTCGIRHVRFWYIEKSSKNMNVEPLKGKAALLGEKKSLSFCDVATGKGLKNGSCFAVSREGILCEFNAKRNLTKWVELRTGGAFSLAVGKRYIYCGCSDGNIRVFEVLSLDYFCTFPKPHYLGAPIAACTETFHLTQHPEDVTYPDCVAVRLDETNHKLYACYNDHSLYIWDVFTLNRIGKYSSFLFHSAAVRDIKMYPELEHESPLPSGSFLTCSNDNTMRVWNLYPHNILPSGFYYPNVYSNELIDIVYIDTEHLIDQDNSSRQNNNQNQNSMISNIHSGSYAVLPGENVSDDYKPGFKCLAITDKGIHIAAGDRMGNVRIYDARFLHKGELVTLEAHDCEVMALEYSASDSEDPHLLATASRDRLLHVLSVDNNYDLVKTLPDHSGSISGVKFNDRNGVLQLVSCSADKSLVFRTATVQPNGILFSREHIVAEKTTFYDLALDSENSLFAAACQDRNIRFYDCETSKLVRTIKGSESDDGNVSKLCMDPTETFIATCCSDKTISLIDKASGDIAATVFGHSESITGLAFTNDSKRLISTCADSCVFVWKLSKQLTQTITNGSDSVRCTSQMSGTAGTVQKNIRGSKFRGRVYSDTKSAAIDPAPLLDDDDLPQWTRSDHMVSTSTGASYPSSFQSHHNNSSNNKFNSYNRNVQTTDEMISIPGGKWADVVTEQFSMAASLNLNSMDDESSVAFCDPHHIFTGNLSVQRCTSGSESNAANVAPSVATVKRASTVLDGSSSKRPGVLNLTTADGSNDNNSATKNRKGVKNSASQSRLPTPSVETGPQPIPLYVGDCKKGGMGAPGGQVDEDGFRVNVNVSSAEQLSPDSVDKETTEGEEDSANEYSDVNEEGLPTTSPMAAKRNNKNRTTATSKKYKGDGDSNKERSNNSNLQQQQSEDEFDDEHGRRSRGGCADGDYDADESPILPRNTRRNSLSSRHLTTTFNSNQRNCDSKKTAGKLTSRLRSFINPSPLLNNRKTFEDIRKDDSSGLKPHSPSFEESSRVVSPKPVRKEMTTAAASAGDRVPKPSLTPVAAKKFGTMKAGVGGGGALTVRPASYNMPPAEPEQHQSSITRSRTDRASVSSVISANKDRGGPIRKKISAPLNETLSNPVSRDRSVEPTITSTNYPPSSRRRVPLGTKVQDPNDVATGAVSARTAQNLKRYKSDNALSRRQSGVASNSTVTAAAFSNHQGNSGAGVSGPASSSLSRSNTSYVSTVIPTESSAAAASSSSSVPGYLKATRSSNLKTQETEQNSSFGGGSLSGGGGGSISGSNTTLHKAMFTSANNNNSSSAANTGADLSEDSLDEGSSSTHVNNSRTTLTKPKKSTKPPIQKYAKSKSDQEKKNLKSWKSADSLVQNNILTAKRGSVTTLCTSSEKLSSRNEETKIDSPVDSKNSNSSFLTPTNPVSVCSVSGQPESSKRATCTTSSVTAPCLFCIRKETSLDDDEGFVSNEYNRYDRCVCSPEQLLRMRPPKNTDPGLSDSDLEDDSDTRSGSEYFVSQQDLNLAGCQKAVNRLNHSFKVVTGFQQQAEYSDEKDEIIQLLTHTCTQIHHTMVSRGMLPSSTSSSALASFNSQKLGPEELQQLTSQLGSWNTRTSSSQPENSTATINLLQHYSDLLVNLVQRQLESGDIQSDCNSFRGMSFSSNVSSTYNNDQASCYDDANALMCSMEENDAEGESTSQDLLESHAASNETLEEI